MANYSETFALLSLLWDLILLLLLLFSLFLYLLAKVGRVLIRRARNPEPPRITISYGEDAPTDCAYYRRLLARKVVQIFQHPLVQLTGITVRNYLALQIPLLFLVPHRASGSGNPLGSDSRESTNGGSGNHPSGGSGDHPTDGAAGNSTVGGNGETPSVEERPDHVPSVFSCDPITVSPSASVCETDALELEDPSWALDSLRLPKDETTSVTEDGPVPPTQAVQANPPRKSVRFANAVARDNAPLVGTQRMRFSHPFARLPKFVVIPVAGNLKRRQSFDEADRETRKKHMAKKAASRQGMADQKSVVLPTAAEEEVKPVHSASETDQQQAEQKAAAMDEVRRRKEAGVMEKTKKRKMTEMGEVEEVEEKKMKQMEEEQEQVEEMESVEGEDEWAGAEFDKCFDAVLNEKEAELSDSEEMVLEPESGDAIVLVADEDMIDVVDIAIPNGSSSGGNGDDAEMDRMDSAQMDPKDFFRASGSSRATQVEGILRPEDCIGGLKQLARKGQ